MNSPEQLKRMIFDAFAHTVYPGDDRLVGSDQGSEPDRVIRDFKGKKDWRTLDPTFIDQSPDELATALAFFSNEAFVFYLPAYLCADLDGKIKMADPVYKLTRYVVGPKRAYGEELFAGFSKEQAKAIVAYLEFKEAGAPPFEKPPIQQALDTYWRRRAAP